MAFTVPNYQQYLDDILQARTPQGQLLNEYYKSILDAEKGDLNRALRRLDEDYARGSRINVEDYDRNKAFSEASAAASQREVQTEATDASRRYYSAIAQQGLEDRGQTEQLQRALGFKGLDDEDARRQLGGNLSSRGVAIGGVGDQERGRLEKRIALGERELYEPYKLGQERSRLQKEEVTGGYMTEQERQRLRREAIDRALSKSQEDLRYGKERGLEEESIKKLRGQEDLPAAYAKTERQITQEKQDKALSLAEANYQREFGKRSTEEGFRLQQESLSKMG